MVTFLVDSPSQIDRWIDISKAQQSQVLFSCSFLPTSQHRDAIEHSSKPARVFVCPPVVSSRVELENSHD